ncbi:MAG: amidase family protein, partial [Microbacterium sp.]
MSSPASPADGPAVKAVRASLAAARDTATTLNAFVRTFDEPALESARAADARAGTGASRGALDGVPYAAKDNLFIAHTPVAAGSPKWAGHSPETSDPAIDRLSSAGAVLIGTTTLPELGVGQVTE